MRYFKPTNDREMAEAMAALTGKPDRTVWCVSCCDTPATTKSDGDPVCAECKAKLVAKFGD